MEECIFCKIIKGEFGTKFSHEDDTCVIFQDIHPKAATHVLVVPKKHITSIAEMDDADEKTVGHLIMAAKKIAETLKLKGYNLHINVGKEGGQEVPHLHVHLMSKFS